MMRAAAVTSSRPGQGPPYGPTPYNNSQQPHNYAQPHPAYAQPPQRPRAVPQGRAPKYTLGTIKTKDGKETDLLTLGDSDDDDDEPPPQPGTSNGANTHQLNYGQQYAPNGYPAPAPVPAGARKRAPPSQGQPQPSSSSNKKRKTNNPVDPYHDYTEKAKVVSDKEGHYIVARDNIIFDEDKHPNQYRVSRLLGMGTFGKVVKAYSKPCQSDDSNERPVAVKVIRAVDKYREAAKVEIKVLNAIVKIDASRGGPYRFRFNQDSQCIHLIKSFMFKKHTCLVTELLGASVFDFLKANSYRGFGFREIQSFARQMLDSIGCLHKNGITHTDLKPENILLVNADSDDRTVEGKVVKRLRSTEIRLIDFGSATFDKEYHATVVSTRHYRAPEIILGLGWSHPCDIWSIGCILVEFYTGEALFQTHENIEHLAMMEKVFGPMPKEYADNAAVHVANDKNNKDKFFRDSFSASGTRHAKLNFPTRATSGMKSSDRNSIAFVQKMKKLDAIIKSEPDSDAANKFYDLIRNLLQWDVKKRWTAERALGAAFCQDQIR